jgi:type I restriction enzyme S subunit
VLLGSLLNDIQPGFASGKHNSTGEGLPHFRPMNVSSQGRIDRSVLKYIDTSTSGRTDQRLRRGDVLFNNTNSPELVGKTALFDEDDGPAFSNHMTRLRSDPAKLDPAYLALRLHQAWREGYFAEHCNNHVSQASVSRAVLRDFPIELPPLELQQAIVALSRSIDGHGISSRNHLAAARRAVERFRQAVLSAACSGRLTADWREDIAPEATTNLLEELTVQRKHVLGSRAKKAVSPAVFDFDIPSGWAVSSLDHVSVRITSGSRDWSRFYGRGSGTFVMAQNVRRGYLDWSFRQAVDPPVGDASRERSQIEVGDLLVTIVGANTGDVGPVTEHRAEHYVCQSVALVRPADSQISPFLNLWFNSPEQGRNYFEDCIYGAGRPHLSFDQLKASPVALPPLAEQREIVRRVEELLASADRLQRRIEVAAHRVDSSSQAVLAKAFRGELLPVAAESSTAPEES